MTTPNQNFETPRHWIGPDELDSSYWSDPAVREKRSQEFHDKPIETLEMIERLDEKGLARRDFLSIMGASMAMASFACARRPVHKIIPYVVQPEEIIPGVANYYASTEPESGYGILVKTREGRPIKLEGNPDHPLTQGKLNARIQASLLDLYDPDRLTGPMGKGGKVLTWEEADREIGAKLKSGKVRVLSKPISGESTRKLMKEFLAKYPGAAWVEYDGTCLEEVAAGQAASYGTACVPHYRFGEADVVVSIGADFLETWPNSIEYTIEFMKRRRLNSQKSASATMSKLYCFESNMSLTGANADERLPIRPGDELKIVMALMHELSSSGKIQAPSAFAGVLSGYSAKAVAEEIGLHGGAKKIQEVAAKLASAKGRGIVIAGGSSAKTADAVAVQVAVNALNSALDNEGSTIDGTTQACFATGDTGSAMEKLVADLNAGQVDVLIVYRANPVYQLPALKFADAMAKAKTSVVIAERADETSVLADYVLADHHYLENWGDARPRKDLWSLQQPVIAPIHSTRSFQDTILAWTKGNASGDGWHQYLKNSWKDSVYSAYGISSGFDAFWEGSLRDGVFNGYAARGNPNPKGSKRSFKGDAAGKIPKFTAAAKDQVFLSLYQTVAMGDGTQANNPWLQEMPDPISTITWDNYLNVGPGLAKSLNVKTNDVVEVKAGDFKVDLPVNVQPGMHDRAVSAAIGYGHSVTGRVSKNCGWNVMGLVQWIGGRAAYAGVPVSLRRTGKSFRLAQTQWHHASENRPIINDITLAEFKKDPTTANHVDPHLRMKEVPTMWKRHEYKGNRWAMAVDLSACTGCGACVIGCQAENNIPVVGRDNVRVSREMHWIRIDRYYAGSPENPDVVFQPMMCQHCENAPCETVCPVIATVHGEDGLNQQIYNRCVGTRYCQNNCPYKVRRFNFFDHWKQYSGTMNMAWNPDVTVRSRGIMEKCTFCVQRIQEGRHKAKDQGSKVTDGMIQTACQQTCAADAIVFGDINDPNSRVSKMAEDGRAFRVLEILNTRPSVHYLSKVRNKEPNHTKGSDHHV
ncbi:MAG: Fe-S-cluster-containing hydrogenase [Bdellovibrionales bacterium]|nr:Fe-S-cluster-containing hydrogenase [Bdellovibrionales bacterium]